jgi:two-component system, NarL family, nitrate/nitrite response regulator NarL
MKLKTGAPKKISIAIVDDHQVLVETLKLVIQHEGDMQVIGDAHSCADCLELIRQICPTILILDVSLPDGDGLNLVSKINKLCPDTAILVLTSFSDEETLMRAMDLGVSGFVGKNQHLTELLSAIRLAAQGEIAIPASLLLGLLGRKPHLRKQATDIQEHEALTPRETEILNCLAQGRSALEIAETLNISPLTVRTHIRNLIEKLGVHSRLEAVTYALQKGLINSPL